MDDVIVGEDLEKKLKKVNDGGKERLQVIADFDRTLTKASMNGGKTPTVIAQIRNGDYLTENYAGRAHGFYDHYHPIEIDPNISDKVRNEKMNEWWMKHFELLVECGFNKNVIKEIVAKRELPFREGSLEMIDYLHENNIPLVIMSAGPGDMIVEYLKQEGRMYDNIHVVANFFDFNDDGKVIKVRKPIIHSHNKHETEVKNLPVYRELLKRKNVILLGDSIADVGMIEGFPYENLIKVGFLNEKVEESLKSFKENFDVVILNDGGMGFVNNIVRTIAE